MNGEQIIGKKSVVVYMNTQSQHSPRIARDTTTNLAGSWPRFEYKYTELWLN